MVGSVGMVRGASQPGSLVIQGALNLLSALGSDSKGTTKKLLMEMKNVQDHNETLLGVAKAAVVEADRREVVVVEKEAELVRNLREAEKLTAGRLSNVLSSEQELQRNMALAHAQISKENETIVIREDSLKSKLGEYQESLRVGNESLAERERALKEGREVLKELESSIKSREENVKSDETGLDNIRNSLDERLTKLDMRDQRIRDAMKDQDIG